MAENAFFVAMCRENLPEGQKVSRTAIACQLVTRARNFVALKHRVEVSSARCFTKFARRFISRANQLYRSKVARHGGTS
jgi:hypothetical protein